MLTDTEQKIARPRQVYTGPAERHVPTREQIVSHRMTVGD
jgi:citrate synthase